MGPGRVCSKVRIIAESTISLISSLVSSLISPIEETQARLCPQLDDKLGAEARMDASGAVNACVLLLRSAGYL